MHEALLLQLRGELAAACARRPLTWTWSWGNAPCASPNLASAGVWQQEKHPESARHQHGTPGMSVRPVVGFCVLHMHRYTILPGGFNAGTLIISGSTLENCSTTLAVN